MMRSNQIESADTNNKKLTQQKIKTSLLILMVLIISVTTIFFTALMLYFDVKDRVRHADSILLTTDTMLRHLYGKKYHNQIKNALSISKEEFENAVKDNDELCRNIGLQYIWSVLVAGGNYYFTSATHSDILNPESACASFFEKHRDPEAFAPAMSGKEEAVFSTFKNEWGEGRMVLIPMKDDFGRTFILGASIQLSRLKDEIRLTIFLSVLIAVIVTVILSIIIIILSSRFVSPILALTESAKQIASGNLDTRFISSGIIEIQSLSDSIEQMQGGLKYRMQSIEKKTREFESLLNSAKVILELNDFKNSARYIFTAAKNMTGAKSGFVTLFNKERTEYDIVLFESEDPPGRINPHPFIRGLLEHVNPTDNVTYENNFMKSEWANFIPEGHIKLKNIMFIPLTLNSNAAGFMILANKSCDFTDDDTYIGEAFGQLAAIALRNNRNMTALLESEAENRMLIEHFNIGIFESTIDGKFLKLNSQVVKVAGYQTAEEMLSMSAISVYANPADREKVVEALQNNGEVRNFEIESIGKSGEKFWVSLSAVLQPEKDGMPGKIFGMLTDITEIKNVQEKISRIQRLNSIGVLAGGIAHDFNNLLNIIYGNLQLMNVQEEDKPNLDACLRTMKRAKGITSQLLTFAKGGVPVKKTGRLIPFLTESIKFALSGSNCSCEFQIPQDLWNVDYDENQIGQVLDNIAINAMQAMPNGGKITLSAKNMKALPENNPVLTPVDYVEIVISDSGTGIPENILEQIFDPYFTTKGAGHGLGLASVHSIINNHGGTVKANSEVGKGTSFTICLPATQKIIFAKTADMINPVKGNGKILLMDDEADMLDMMEKILSSAGYRTVKVSEGRAVLETLKNPEHNEEPFKAVILDLTIPGRMGGKETIVEIRKFNPDIPVFVYSGYSDDPIMADPEKYGFNGSLAKPFDPGQLLELLSEKTAN